MKNELIKAYTDAITALAGARTEEEREYWLVRADSIEYQLQRA